MSETLDLISIPIDHRQLAAELVERARTEGMDLVGSGGLGAC